MILHEIILDHLELTYRVLVNKIQITNKTLKLTNLFDIINQLQTKYNNSIIQFFDDTYLLNEEHLLKAIYFTEKAFKQNINISNKKSIELLLYLSANRQIEIGIETFGIKENVLNKKPLIYCIVSEKDPIQLINSELLYNFEYKTLDPIFNKKTIDNYKRIRNFYQITENQIATIFHLLNPESSLTLNQTNLSGFYNVLLDLICEKMALLSLEMVKYD